MYVVSGNELPTFKVVCAVLKENENECDSANVCPAGMGDKK